MGWKRLCGWRGSLPTPDSHGAQLLINIIREPAASMGKDAGRQQLWGNQPGGLKGQPANLTAYCLLPDGTLIPS